MAMEDAESSIRILFPYLPWKPEPTALVSASTRIPLSHGNADE
jgi:hypothetical protein